MNFHNPYLLFSLYSKKSKFNNNIKKNRLIKTNITAAIINPQEYKNLSHSQFIIISKLKSKSNMFILLQNNS